MGHGWISTFLSDCIIIGLNRTGLPTRREAAAHGVHSGRLSEAIISYSLQMHRLAILRFERFSNVLLLGNFSADKST